MIQFLDKTTANERISEIEKIQAKVAEKEKAIEELTFEKDKLKECADKHVKDYLQLTSGYVLERLPDLCRSFNAVEAIKNNTEQISGEYKDKYGTWTEERAGLAECVRTAVFDDKIIKEYNPELLEIDYCFEYAYEFCYRVGNQTIIFIVPMRLDGEYHQGFKLRVAFKETNYTLSFLFSSYFETEIRDFTTKWVKDNRKNSEGKHHD